MGYMAFDEDIRVLSKDIFYLLQDGCNSKGSKYPDVGCRVCGVDRIGGLAAVQAFGFVG